MVSAGYDPSLVVAPSPVWNNTAVVFPNDAHLLLFTGLQDMILLYGILYQLRLQVTIDGTAAPTSYNCTSKLPFQYSSSTVAFALAPCSPGLVGVNYTQQCSPCPANAACNGTQVFASPGSHVWRPNHTVLPFTVCPTGYKGCAPAMTDRIGNECDDGYEGPLCGNCVEGYAHSGVGECAQCYSPAVNIAVSTALAFVVAGVLTFTAVNSVPKPCATSVNPILQIGLQSVKAFTNHFSLFGLLAHTEVASILSGPLRAALMTQNSASGPSPTSNSFIPCLFPQWTANELFLCVMLVIVVFIVAEILIVRVVRKCWAPISVSAAILQLGYIQLLQAALSLLRYQTYSFYDSTMYLSSASTDALPRILHLDLLVSDARLDVNSNTLYFRLAWSVLVLGGFGIPLWFVAAYMYVAKRESPESARSKLQFIVKGFKDDRWFWESVVTARKGLSVMFLGALAAYPAIQLQAIGFIYVLYFIAHERYEPFALSAQKVVERSSYAAAIFTANAMLALYAVPDNSIATAPGTVCAVACIAVQFVALVLLCREPTRQVLEIKRNAAKAAKQDPDLDISTDAINMEISQTERSHSMAPHARGRKAVPHIAASDLEEQMTVIDESAALHDAV